MTTPTREQVVQLITLSAEELKELRFSSIGVEGIQLRTMQAMMVKSGKVIAALEATITKQADELKKLRTENGLLKQVETNLCELHNVALAELESLQCKIDALMLEYCPDEMTEEQKVEWARHQQPVSDEKQRAVDAAIAAAPKQGK